MNTNQRQGTLKIMCGIAQELIGILLFSAAQRRQGFARRIAGEAQKAIGDADRFLERRRARPVQTDVRRPVRLSWRFLRIGVKEAV